MAGARPSGTVTFLFTDIEGSTRLWEDHPEEMRTALARHDEILRDAIETGGGYIFATGGDGFAAAFTSADDAVAAAVTAQRRLAQDTSAGLELRVRMGLHAGTADEREGDYFGPVVNAAARIMAAAHGGQIVASGVVRGLSTATSAAWADLGDHRLSDVEAVLQLLQVLDPDLDGQFPPLQTASAPSTNLVDPLDRFIGRDELIAELTSTFDEARLLTLTGVGGVGKTRLATHMGRVLLPRFRDGVWMVELAAVTEPHAVPEAVAAVFGLSTARDVQELLTEALRSRDMLLVIDNCEHLLGPCEALVTQLLEHCPKLRVLATSREGLGCPGEIQRTVPSLRTDSAAVDLYIDRATALRPDLLELDGARGSIAELCARLDGIPLAIELAAARSKVMTPAETLERLDQRFKILAGGSRGALKRQQTMLATIEWSHDLLEQPEQAMFRRLSTFFGGFTMDGAEAVAVGADVDPSDVLDGVVSLVEKSLLDVTVVAGETRYTMLETLREFGLTVLRSAGEGAAYRRAHADYMAARMTHIGLGQCGPDETDWVRRLDADLENLRSAVSWATSTHDTDLAVRLVAPLARPRMSLRNDVIGIARAVLELDVDAHPQVASVAALGLLNAYATADLERGSAIAERFTVLEDDPTVARGLAMLRLLSGDFDVAAELCARGAAVALAENDDVERGHNLIGQAFYLHARGDFDAAAAVAREARTIADRLDNPTMRTNAALALGAALLGSDPHAAIDAFTEATDAVPGSNLLGRGDGFWFRGQTMNRLGRHQEALADLRRASLILHETWAAGELGGCAIDTALIAARHGLETEAQRLIDHATATPAWRHMAISRWIAEELEAHGIDLDRLGAANASLDEELAVIIGAIDLLEQRSSEPSA